MRVERALLTRHSLYYARVGVADAGYIIVHIDITATARIEQIRAFTEELVIVSSIEHHNFDREPDGSWSLVAFEPGCPHRKRLLDWVEGRGEGTARLVEMGSYHAILGCVLIGMGISLMPRSVLDTFPEKKRLFLQLR